MPDSSGFPCQIPTTAPGEAWRGVFNLAASRIERDGWARGMGVGPLGQRCVGFALVEARQQIDGPYGCVGMLARYLGLSDFAEVIDWNDAPERTAAEVIAALRACAESVP